MLTIIEDKVENCRAQRRMEKMFRDMTGRSEKLNIGWQGGNTWTKISWSNDLGLWWSFLDDRDGTVRYWRAFGIEEPRWGTNTSHAIKCEINSPFKNFSRRIGGAFASDNAGNAFLIHRGNIGGGKKGVGKNLFLDYSNAEKCIVRDPHGEVEVALVGTLESKRFCKQVSEFVHDIAKIRSLGNSEPKDAVLKSYDPEYIGQKKYRVVNTIVSNCDHGLLVDAMRKLLEKQDKKVSKDRYCDLYLLNTRGVPQTIFEFKTDDSLSSVYSAIGQLLFRSVQWPSAKLVSVFPDTISNSVTAKLRQLEIHCVTYRWDKNYPRFRSIQNLV